MEMSTPVLVAVMVVLAALAVHVGTKRIVLGILSSYQSLNVLRLRLLGRTPKDEAQRRVVSGKGHAAGCPAPCCAPCGSLGAQQPDSTDPRLYATQVRRGPSSATR